MRFLCILLGLLCCRLCPAAAQDQWQADPVLSRYMLSQLVQDGAGFLWASTSDGIFRYDGYQTIALNQLISGRQPALPATPFALVPGKKGELWLQGAAGLFRYSYAQQRVSAIAVARSETDDPGQGILTIDTLRNRYWLTLSAHSVTAMQLQHERLVPTQTYQFQSPVTWTVLDTNGDLWVVTLDNTITRITPTGRQHYHGPANRRLFPVLGTSPQQFFSACAQYAARPDGSLYETKRWLPFRVNDFTEETAFWPFVKTGAEQWVAGGYLVRLQRVAGRANITGAVTEPLRFRNSEGYDSPPDYQIFTDALGMEWGFCGSTRGCYKRRCSAGIQPLRNTRNHFFSTRAITRLPDGRLLVSTYSTVLLQPARQPAAPLAYWPVPYTGRQNLLVAYDVLPLPAHRLLVAAEDNLYEVNTTTWQKTPIGLNPRQMLRPNSLARDAAGRVWIAAATGLFWLDTARLLLHPYQGWRTKRVQGSIKTLAFATDGRLWLATTNGLYLLETATGCIQHFATQLPLPHRLPTNQLLCLHLAGTQVWVGTQDQGLLLVDPMKGVVRQVTTATGLPSNTVCSLLPDEQANLWLGTYAGVVRYRPATGATAVFTTYDGLADNECNYRAAWRDADGALYFGSIKGLTRFLPRQVNSNYSPCRRLNISRIMYRLDGDTLRRWTYPSSGTTHQFNLTDDAQVQLQVASSDYLSPEDTKYWYRLQGAADSVWHQLPASRTLDLQYLPAGSYTIAFRAQSANGVDAVNRLTIPLQEHRTWWKQPWWQVAVFVALASCVGGSLLLIRRQQRQRFQQLRGRLADDLHDELGALLVRASFQAEALKYEQPVQLSTANHLLASIQEASQAMRDIAWGIDPNANTFGNLLDRMQDYIDKLPATGRCRTKIIQSTIPPDKTLEAAVRQHIYYIFKEAVTNALRHAHTCETLTISLLQHDHQLVLQVDNDGAPVLSIRPGMGLRSMRRRAQEVAGRLEAGPRSSGGFRVVLAVPSR